MEERKSDDRWYFLRKIEPIKKSRAQAVREGSLIRWVFCIWWISLFFHEVL